MLDSFALSFSLSLFPSLSLSFFCALIASLIVEIDGHSFAKNIHVNFFKVTKYLIVSFTKERKEERERERGRYTIRGVQVK